jgi:hypothetical protein
MHAAMTTVGRRAQTSDTAPALAAPEGISRAQAQRDRLQDQAAYPAWDGPEQTNAGE